MLFDYIDGGSYAEATLRRNVEDFERIALRQRVLRDVSGVRAQTRLFGQHLSMPVVLAPVGMAGMYARRGELQAARAASAAGAPFCLSTLSICSLEEVAGAAPPPWFQLYMIKDRGYMRDLLQRAEAVAAPVLVFTVDLPTPGARYRDVRAGLFGGARRHRTLIDGALHPAWLWDVWVRGRPHSFGNVAAAIPEARGVGDFWVWVAQNFDPTLTWADLDWVRSNWSGPIVLKGVLDVDDARTAAKAGVDGLVVSNHGGRQLDSALSSIEALAAVVDAVGDETTVLMDGGVRSGLDVLKALAVGAKACLIGRAWAYALATDGERGVTRMLETLRQELLTAMALTGCTDIAEASATLLA